MYSILSATILLLNLGCHSSFEDNRKNRRFQEEILNKQKYSKIVENDDEQAMNAEPETSKQNFSSQQLKNRQFNLVNFAPRLRILSKYEYSNAIKDATGINILAEEVLDDPKIDGYDNVFGVLNYNSQNVSNKFELSKVLANKLLDEGFLKCKGEGWKCILPRIEELYQQLTSKNLPNSLESNLSKIYIETFKNISSDSAKKALIRIVLQSPYFLTYDDINYENPTEYNRAVIRRLFFTIWGSIPPRHLIGNLKPDSKLSKAEIIAIAKKYIDSEKTSDHFVHFVDNWLKIKELDKLVKDKTLFPSFPKLKQSLHEEFRRNTVDAFIKGDLSNLLGSNFTFVNKQLADFYGINWTNEKSPKEFYKVEYGKNRKGILSTGLFLSSHSKMNDTHVIDRGRLVMERLLYRSVPAPDEDIPLENPDSSAEKTVREKLEVHKSNPKCATCHNTMDDLGLAMENYDTIGKYRNAYSFGATIDASGTLVKAEDKTFSFSNFIDLVSHLEKSEIVKRCFVKNYIGFLAGNNIEDGKIGRDTIEYFVQKLNKNNGSLRELLLEFIKSDLFFVRTVKPQLP